MVHKRRPLTNNKILSKSTVIRVPGTEYSANIRRYQCRYHYQSLDIRVQDLESRIALEFEYDSEYLPVGLIPRGDRLNTDRLALARS